MLNMDINATIDYYSMMMNSIDHFVICKAALAIVITRFIFFWAHRFLNKYYMFHCDESAVTLSSSSLELSLEMARQNINSTTFGDIQDRLINEGGLGSCKKSCAVCLESFTRKSQVSELCNCGHVFHRMCLDRWLRYDIARMTCPLCRRTCLINNNNNVISSQLIQDSVSQQPNWAVERILYMFGDDLLCDHNTCSSSSSS